MRSSLSLFFYYPFFIFCSSLSVSLLVCHAGYLRTQSHSYFSSFSFAMEGCRYNGMQRRLPAASQWMDRVKQQGDEEREKKAEK